MNHTLDDSVGQMLTAMQTHSQRAAGPRQIALADVVRSSGAGLQLRCAGLRVNPIYYIEYLSDQ